MQSFQRYGNKKPIYISFFCGIIIGICIVIALDLNRAVKNYDHRYFIRSVDYEEQEAVLGIRKLVENNPSCKNQERIV